jgi:UDP-N-acetylmuramyl pentapeptide phosphotransferase/UDP-N-acetylglucosamine-1-phosphate transferase
VLTIPAFAGFAVDVPSDRSLHTTAMPRTGGIGLLLGAGVAGALLPVAGLGLIVGLTAALAAIFFVDDLRGLPVSVRISAQAVAATVFVIWDVDASSHLVLLAFLLVPGIVWCMNAYNFMDGTNGLAGGMAVFGFGAYAIAGHAAGVTDLAVAAAIVSGAALGFLIWNFDPARIFLGDAGSIALGFLAAIIGFLGWERGVWPFWFPPLIFSPFLLDATVTLLRRALRGEDVWRAHKSHYYQRLVRVGWSHRRLSLVGYTLMAVAAGSALLARNAAPQIVIALLCAWVMAYAVIAVSIDRWWSSFQMRNSQC